MADKAKTEDSSKPTQFEDHGLMVFFGEKLEDKCLMSKGTMLRMAKLLVNQHENKIHHLDVIVERRLLADKANNLALSRQVSTVF